MKKTLSLLAISFISLPSVSEAVYPVNDARGNMLLQQIKSINQSHLNTSGQILGVNRDELKVLEAIYNVLGEPEDSSRILTGDTDSSDSSDSSDAKATTPTASDVVSGLTNSVAGINLSNFSSANGILGNVGSIMADIEGYEDFDIGSMFAGLGRINTFINGDFNDFKDFIGDPTEEIAKRIKEQAFGYIEGGGVLSDMESEFGKRLLRMAKEDSQGNRKRLLKSVSDIFMARVMDNVTESAQRNEVLSVETQKAYEAAAKATTFTEQMAAQNRIEAGNNMIELEKTRVMNDTAAANVTLQGKELDVLEFQELDRNLDNALK